MDTEKLYRRLAGKTKDADKQSRYRSLAESVSAAVHQMNIANGQKVKIEVLFDKELAKELGVKIKAKDYTVRAKGIDAGTKIDLFSNDRSDLCWNQPRMRMHWLPTSGAMSILAALYLRRI